MGGGRGCDPPPPPPPRAVQEPGHRGTHWPTSLPSVRPSRCHAPTETRAPPTGAGESPREGVGPRWARPGVRGALLSRPRDGVQLSEPGRPAAVPTCPGSAPEGGRAEGALCAPSADPAPQPRRAVAPGPPAGTAPPSKGQQVRRGAESWTHLQGTGRAGERPAAPRHRVSCAGEGATPLPAPGVPLGPLCACRPVLTPAPPTNAPSPRRGGAPTGPVSPAPAAAGLPGSRRPSQRGARTSPRGPPEGAARAARRGHVGSVSATDPKGSRQAAAALGAQVPRPLAHAWPSLRGPAGLSSAHPQPARTRTPAPSQTATAPNPTDATKSAADVPPSPNRTAGLRGPRAAGGGPAGGPDTLPPPRPLTSLAHSQ